MEDSLKSRSDISVVLIFFIALTILGVIGAGYAVNDYARARASATWPVYDGVVLSRRGPGAALRYAYSVDGRTYETGRVRFFSGLLSRETAATQAGAGETVKVYVDPDNHAFAVLAPGGGGAVFVAASLITGACVFLGVGGVVRTLTTAIRRPGEREAAAF